MLQTIVSEYQGDVQIRSDDELNDGVDRDQLTDIHVCKGPEHHQVSISGLSHWKPGDNRFDKRICMKISELWRESCGIEAKRHSNVTSGAKLHCMCSQVMFWLKMQVLEAKRSSRSGNIPESRLMLRVHYAGCKST